MRTISLITLLAAAPAAFAEENLPITPENAALACQARVEHDLREKGGSATALDDFETRELESGARRIEGVYAVTIDGERRETQATCVVSSRDGVESFDLTITPLED